MRLTFHGTLLGVILLLLAMMALGPARQLYNEQQHIRSDERALAAGDAETAQLVGRLQAMKDPNHLELLARQELGYVRPGEVSYVIVRPQPAATEAPKVKPKARSWWQRGWSHMRHPW
ncbi:MAG TPA: septum formation initiator family protein [Actinomycetota bacterium]|nr:septum formation initiator family protein [Actinomycetota bacterium]